MNNGGGGWGLLGLGLSLGAALLLSTVIVSETLLTVKRDGQTVEVKGFAEQHISSDFAVWRATFTTRNARLRDASRELEQQRGAVLAFLREQGVPEAEIELTPVQTQVLFARDPQGGVTNRVEGYALGQELRVSSSDIERTSRVSQNSAELIKLGIELNSWQPEYFYTKLDELKIAMLGEATADARNRAEELARRSQSRIGALRWARQGVFQITPAHSTEVSDYGRNDTSSREKTIKAVVTVRYALES